MATRTIDLGRVVGPKGDPGEPAFVDPAPTSGSLNAVSSGGTYEALQGKQDIPTGAASTVMASNLSADKVVITNSSGKLAASPVSSDMLGNLANLGTLYAANLTAYQETTATRTEILSLELPAGTYVVVGWCEIMQIVKDGRYGLQLYVDSETVTPVVTTQNIYQNPTMASAVVGFNFSYIFEAATTKTIHLRLLAPANLNGTVVTITRAKLQALRII